MLGSPQDCSNVVMKSQSPLAMEQEGGWRQKMGSKAAEMSSTDMKVQSGICSKASHTHMLTHEDAPMKFHGYWNLDMSNLLGAVLIVDIACQMCSGRRQRGSGGRSGRPRHDRQRVGCWYQI